ncbi:hypothetical protein OF001_U50006 [Pseudomonas sp. OF001]|nr:hypothetical protein OF001_U50006 [Pseudomonas sp. OF001]
MQGGSPPARAGGRASACYLLLRLLLASGPVPSLSNLAASGARRCGLSNSSLPALRNSPQPRRAPRRTAHRRPTGAPCSPAAERAKRPLAGLLCRYGILI